MRCLFATSLFFLMSISIFAESIVGQRFDNLTLQSGITLKRVKIISISGDEVLIMHSGGAENYSLKLLPGDLQAKVKSEAAENPPKVEPKPLAEIATFSLEVFLEDPASDWRSELAKQLGGSVLNRSSGYIYVIAERYAVNVVPSTGCSAPQEHLGEYAAAIGKTGVLAVMCDAGPISDESQTMIYSQYCKPYGLRLLLLESSKGTNKEYVTAWNKYESENKPSYSKPAPTPPQRVASGKYWISSTGKTHNSKCQFYGNTKSGHDSSVGSGDNCQKCGGAR